VLLCRAFGFVCAIGTKTFALIVDDADAPKGEGTHWIVYNIPEENPVVEEEVSSGDGISKVAEVLTTKPPPPPPVISVMSLLGCRSTCSTGAAP
jgi:hypothetical protein